MRDECALIFGQPFGVPRLANEGFLRFVKVLASEDISGAITPSAGPLCEVGELIAPLDIRPQRIHEPGDRGLGIVSLAHEDPFAALETRREILIALIPAADGDDLLIEFGRLAKFVQTGLRVE